VDWVREMRKEEKIKNKNEGKNKKKFDLGQKLSFL
jgi:hypothetical protein